MTQLGGTYDENSGNIVWENGDAAGEIIQNAVEYFKVELSDPLNQKDESDIYSEIFDKVNVLTANTDLRDIATNYPTFEFTPPTGPTNNPPPGTPAEPGSSATEDLSSDPYDEAEE